MLRRLQRLRPTSGCGAGMAGGLAPPAGGRPTGVRRRQQPPAAGSGDLAGVTADRRSIAGSGAVDARRRSPNQTSSSACRPSDRRAQRRQQPQPAHRVRRIRRRRASATPRGGDAPRPPACPAATAPPHLDLAPCGSVRCSSHKVTCHQQRQRLLEGAVEREVFRLDDTPVAQRQDLVAGRQAGGRRARPPAPTAPSARRSSALSRAAPRRCCSSGRARGAGRRPARAAARPAADRPCRAPRRRSGAKSRRAHAMAQRGRMSSSPMGPLPLARHSSRINRRASCARPRAASGSRHSAICAPWCSS